jgi:hypothetical protein
LELYKWGNDTSTLAALWPHVVKAAEWQIAVAQAVGIPQHLVATYDILGLDQYPTATYNGVFHLMAMQAAKELAVAMGNATLAQACAAAFVRGQQALDTLLWQGLASVALPGFAINRVVWAVGHASIGRIAPGNLRSWLPTDRKSVV